MLINKVIVFIIIYEKPLHPHLVPGLVYIMAIFDVKSIFKMNSLTFTLTNKLTQKLYKHILIRKVKNMSTIIESWP